MVGQEPCRSLPPAPACTIAIAGQRHHQENPVLLSGKFRTRGPLGGQRCTPATHPTRKVFSGLSSELLSIRAIDACHCAYWTPPRIDDPFRHRTRTAQRASSRRSRTTNCDQRHSYAVRAARNGTPAEPIARQLGHANAVLVLKIYGRFMPSHQDRDKWESIGDIQDQESAASCTNSCTRPSNDMSQPPVSAWLTNSRGGTRTRDPGIMSSFVCGVYNVRSSQWRQRAASRMMATWPRPSWIDFSSEACISCCAVTRIAPVTYPRRTPSSDVPKLVNRPQSRVTEFREKR
jgi:hypothetical protein